MTYRICVWEDDSEGWAWNGEMAHHELARRHEGSPMAPKMLAFLAKLMAEWACERADDATAEESYTWPLALEAWGPVMCIQIEPGQAEAVARRISDLAREEDFVVHVPEGSDGTLRPRSPWELP